MADEPTATPPPASKPDPDRMPRWIPKAILYVFGGVVAFTAGRWLLGTLHDLLVLLLISLFLSLAIEPAVNSLARRGWRRGVATGTVLGAVLVGTLLFVAAIGTLVVNQVANLVDRAPEYVQDIEDWVNDTFDANIDADQIIDDLTTEDGPIRKWAESLADNSIALTTQALGILLSAFSVGLFTFYLVADGPHLRRQVCSLFRPDVQREVLRGWEVAIDKTGGYLYSRALLATISGIVTTVFLLALQVPYAVALGFWVGVVSQFLPVIGTYLAGVLPVLVALVDDPVKAIWVLVFIVAYQQVENYLFAPRITARTMSVHPALAFGSVIAGAAILGPVGAVLAVPFAASVQAFASAYVRRQEVVDSHLTTVPARKRPWRRHEGEG